MTTMPTAPPHDFMRTEHELHELVYQHRGTAIEYGSDGWALLTVAGQVYAAPAGGAR